MSLSPKELARRIQAARALNGLSQADLGELVKADGFGRYDISRLERAGAERPPKKPPPPLSPARIRSLAQATGVPECWFTQADKSKLFNWGETESLATQVTELKRKVEQITRPQAEGGQSVDVDAELEGHFRSRADEEDQREHG